HRPGVDESDDAPRGRVIDPHGAAQVRQDLRQCDEVVSFEKRRDAQENEQAPLVRRERGTVRQIASGQLPDLRVRRAARVTQMSPDSGLEALAWSLRGIRPARNALRPALTASFIADAMRQGSFAEAMAVFIRTP